MKKTRKNYKTLSHDQLREVQSKYTSSIEWIKGDRPSYAQAQRKGLIETVAPHFVSKRPTRTKEECLESARKYKNSKEWQSRDPRTYQYQNRQGWTQEITSQVFRQPLWSRKWDRQQVFKTAKECQTMTDMENRFPGAYDAARRLGIFDELKKILVPVAGSSLLERDVLEWCRSIFIDTEIIHKRQISSKGMRREIDIYMPQINAGIEVDGGYWHGEWLIKQGKSPVQKHKEKDDFFQGLGISILHISEDEWKKGRSLAERKIIEFIKSREHTGAN